MATNPYFALSPSTIISIIGLLHGPDKTTPNPAKDWQEATVDVVIPALNEDEYIVLCLASLARQTFKPRQVILVDDGSTDHTYEYATRFAESIDLNLISIKREKTIGKTPTLKHQARESDADVELILDGDTVLESENYIERVVQELYQGAGIASACGVVLPMREKDRKQRILSEPVRGFLEDHPEVRMDLKANWLHRLNRNITNIYRSVLYMFIQRFVYHGQMVFFGSIINPVGCAVAYRREFVKELFDHYEPILSDNLTNSEDIFIGFAFLEQGYRNIQLTDVYARSIEPEIQNLPHQLYLWSSSFLQSCFYFDDLLRSPLKGLRRFKRRRHEKQDKEHQKLVEKRIYTEQYRQAFGTAYSQEFGRPMGWVLFTVLIEKLFFPMALIVLAILQVWEPLGITILAESIVSLTILTIISQGQRLEMLMKGIVTIPIRYATLLFDVFIIGRFATELWFTKERRWRK